MVSVSGSRFPHCAAAYFSSYLTYIICRCHYYTMLVLVFFNIKLNWEKIVPLIVLDRKNDFTAQSQNMIITVV